MSMQPALPELTYSQSSSAWITGWVLTSSISSSPPLPSALNRTRTAMTIIPNRLHEWAVDWSSLLPKTDVSCGMTERQSAPAFCLPYCSSQKQAYEPFGPSGTCQYYIARFSLLRVYIN